jgi:hypothetical protein
VRVALELLLRTPQLVHGAALHEPAMLAILADGPFREVPRRLTALVLEGLAAEPDMVAERFVRMGSRDGVWERLHPELRRRLVGNGRLFAEAVTGRLSDE